MQSTLDVEGKYPTVSITLMLYQFMLRVRRQTYKYFMPFIMKSYNT
jgi:hypothetical protein